MNPFEDFVRFIECELALLASDREKKRAEIDMRQSVTLLDREREKGDMLKKHIAQLHKDMHAYELESRTHAQREKEVRQRLDITRNAKEYDASRREIEELERTRDACEDRLMEKLVAYEEAQKEFDDRREELEAAVEGRQQIVREKQERIRELESKKNELVETCSELRSAVSPEFLEKYDRMKETVTDPFIPVIGSHCSACNFEVAQKDLILIHKHLFVACKNCYRMLYEPLG